MSALGSCTESWVVDEEFEEESNINQEAKEFDFSETKTVPSHVSQARVERNKEEVENERNQEEEREGGSKLGATKDEKIRDRKQVKVEITEEKGRWKRRGDTVEERKSQAKRRKEGPALAGESKDEVIDEKKLGRQRKKKGEMTEARRERNREAELVGFQKAEVNQDDEGRKKRKQQCRGVRSCMAMGCTAIAGFTSALILVALANIPYVEETVYLFPT